MKSRKNTVKFNDEFRSKLVKLLGEYGFAYSGAQEYRPGRYEIRIIPISISPPLNTKRILSFTELPPLEMILRSGFKTKKRNAPEGASG